MLRNYLLVALRNLRKNRSYAIVNMLGLGIAMACCITAYLVLAFNIEFDSYYSNEKVADIFKVHAASRDKGGIERLQAMAPLALAPAAVSDIPGIKSYCRLVVTTGSLAFEDKVINEEIDFVDSTFFQMFELPLLKGNSRSIQDKNSIFLSESVAKKYFGDEDPIGKIMAIHVGDNEFANVIVAGVLQDIPVNNTFTIVTLMRIEKWLEWGGLNADDWKEWREASTFMRLEPPGAAQRVSDQLKQYVSRRNESIDYSTVISYKLEPFLAAFDYETVSGSYINLRLSTVPVFTIVALALLILVIACFNLTNTSLALTVKRLKEVGVRKVVGARASQIAVQFMLENFIIVVLAILAGLILSQFIVPAFMNMWQVSYRLEDLKGTNLVIAVTCLIFVAAVLAGTYPSLFSNSFNSTLLIKGNVRIGGTNAFTRTLVGLQFALSVVVLVVGVASIQNAAYQERISFGYDRDMLITVGLQGGDDFEIMEKELSSDPRIISVGVSNGNLGANSYHTPVNVDTGTYDVRVLAVGKNFFETIGLQLVKGRTFNIDNASDRETAVVNVAFLKKVGLEEALDKVVTIHGGRVRIVGVVENHVDDLFRSKHFEPFIFYPTTEHQYISLLVKTRPEDLIETEKTIAKIWKRVFPMKPYESRFQEDLVMRNIRDRNANVKNVFLFITFLGAVMSASGIYALASMNISRRTKEIGVRKVLGASTSQIVSILNREFVIILAVAGLLGALGGYYCAMLLLDRLYAYHIDVNMLVALLCGLAIFAVGIMTTSTSIIKAAIVNPVDTLRSE